MYNPHTKMAEPFLSQATLESMLSTNMTQASRMWDRVWLFSEIDEADCAPVLNDEVVEVQLITIDNPPSEG